MKLQLDFTNNTSETNVPELNKLQRWIEHALEPTLKKAIVSICVVDAPEIQRLNSEYRQKDYPTNVLSFPNQAPAQVYSDFLGDIVVCAQVIAQEAQAQDKPLEAHWAHMVIHSTLHLQGYDHQTTQDAQKMESKEIALMQQLGFSDPYKERQ